MKYLYKIGLLFSLLFFFRLSAQNEYKVWYFEGNAGFDFNKKPAEFLNFNQFSFTNRSTQPSVMCDTTGKLLFYTDGAFVWDANHQLIQNGDSLVKLYANNSPLIKTVIIPKPKNKNKYYILSSLQGTSNNSEAKLSLSELDMTLNNGKGGITNIKRIKIYNGFNYFSDLTVTKHENNNDFWLCAVLRRTDSLYLFKIDSNGFNNVPIIKKLPLDTNCVIEGQCIRFSPDGKILYVPVIGDTIKNFNIRIKNYLLRFNKQNGDISKHIILEDSIASYYGNWSFGDFSANSRFLYVNSIKENTQTSSIIQYDLKEWDVQKIRQSKTNLYSIYFGYQNYTQFLDIRLAPDHKIYLSNNNNRLMRINFPDKKGSACDFQDSIPNTSPAYPGRFPNMISSVYYNKIMFTRNCKDDSTTFKISNSDIDSAFWDFGDPSSGQFNQARGEENIIHIFRQSGNFRVRLITWFNDEADTFYRWVNIPRVKPFIGKDTFYCGAPYFPNSIGPEKDYEAYKWSNFSVSKYIKPTQPGNYILTVKDSNECYGSDTIFIANPRIKANFNLSDTIQCLNNNSFKITDISSLLNTKLKSRVFTFDGNDPSSDSLFNKTFTQNGVFKVKLKIIAQEGCADSLTKTLHVVYSPKSQFSINDSIQCFKSHSFDFNNTSDTASGVGFKWLIDTQLISTKHVLNRQFAEDSFHSISLISSVNGICSDTFQKPIYVAPNPRAVISASSDSACLSGNGFVFNSNSSTGTNLQSHWLASDSTASVQSSSYFHRFSSSGTHQIRLIAIGEQNCADTAIKDITVFDSPVLDFDINSDNQCLKDHSFDFTNQSSILSGTLNYTWRLGDAETRQTEHVINKTYTKDSIYQIVLVAISDKQCSDSIQKQITVSPNPVSSFQILDSLPCSKDLVLNLQSNSNYKNVAPNHTTQWGDGNVNTSNGNGKLTHSYTASGTYEIVQIAQIGNCSDTFSQTIMIVQRPDIRLSFTRQCLGDSTWILASNQAAKQEPLNYKWNIDSGNIVQNDSLIHHIFQKAGLHHVIVEAGNGSLCYDTTSINISIVEPPKADFSYSYLGVSNQQVQFRFFNKSSNYDELMYHFENDTISNPFPFYNFKDTGWKTVKLIVGKQGLCFDTLIQELLVLDKINYFFPTAFSPNGNQINDGFGLTPNQWYLVKDFELKIFNRWGEMMYSSSKKEETWHAEKALQGVYIYTVEIRDIYNQTHTLKGVVEVLR